MSPDLGGTKHVQPHRTAARRNRARPARGQPAPTPPGDHHVGSACDRGAARRRRRRGSRGTPPGRRARKASSGLPAHSRTRRLPATPTGAQVPAPRHLCATCRDFGRPPPAARPAPQSPRQHDRQRPERHSRASDTASQRTAPCVGVGLVQEGTGPAAPARTSRNRSQTPWRAALAVARHSPRTATYSHAARRGRRTSRGGWRRRASSRRTASRLGGPTTRRRAARRRCRRPRRSRRASATAARWRRGRAGCGTHGRPSRRPGRRSTTR